MVPVAIRFSHVLQPVMILLGTIISSQKLSQSNTCQLLQTEMIKSRTKDYHHFTMNAFVKLSEFDFKIAAKVKKLYIKCVRQTFV